MPAAKEAWSWFCRRKELQADLQPEGNFQVAGEVVCCGAACPFCQCSVALCCNLYLQVAELFYYRTRHLAIYYTIHSALIAFFKHCSFQSNICCKHETGCNNVKYHKKSATNVRTSTKMLSASAQPSARHQLQGRRPPLTPWPGALSLDPTRGFAPRPPLPCAPPCAVQNVP